MYRTILIGHDNLRCLPDLSNLIVSPCAPNTAKPYQKKPYHSFPSNRRVPPAPEPMIRFITDCRLRRAFILDCRGVLPAIASPPPGRISAWNRYAPRPLSLRAASIIATLQNLNKRQYFDIVRKEEIADCEASVIGLIDFFSVDAEARAPD